MQIGITNNIVLHSIEQSVKTRKHISCKAGCGSCCAHAVPVTKLEALNLANVVKNIPGSRQPRIRQRFADSQSALATAGLEGAFREITNLDKQSCSIYQDRPLECRDYLITFAPKHCEQLNAEKIQPIDSKLRLTPALTKQSQECFGEKSDGWIPMLYCLDWAKSDNTILKKSQLNYDYRNLSVLQRIEILIIVNSYKIEHETFKDGCLSKSYLPIKRRNSLRVASEVRIEPNMTEVIIDEFCF
jgi:Fe-S-cluster containining protein